MAKVKYKYSIPAGEIRQWLKWVQVSTRWNDDKLYICVIHLPIGILSGANFWNIIQEIALWEFSQFTRCVNREVAMTTHRQNYTINFVTQTSWDRKKFRIWKKFSRCSRKKVRFSTDKSASRTTFEVCDNSRSMGPNSAKIYGAELTPMQADWKHIIRHRSSQWAPEADCREKQP